MAEDPEKKILDWCGHLAVPRLVDEKAYSNCKGCQTNCGHMFCSSCTQKYHIPLIFRIKNKEGPARVCMSCVEGCMAEKAKAQSAGSSSSNPSSASGPPPLTSALSTSAMVSNLQSMARVVEIAPPAVWEEESSFVSCPKCSTKKAKTHNCRVCGILFCEKCTSKMDIPSYFDKKGKTGPLRCCDGCRFKIVNGAKFVERLSQPPNSVKKTPPPPPAGFIGHDRRVSRAVVSKCQTIGCLAMSVAADGRCQQHTTMKPVSSEVTIVIRREGSDAVVATLSLPSGDSPLSALDVLFKKTAPQSDAYSYVFRGQPIPEPFHNVFLAKHLGSTVFIRPARKLAMATIDEPQIAEMVSTHQSKQNPFKADTTGDLAKRAAEKEAAEKAKLKQQQAPKLVFKKPNTSYSKLNFGRGPTTATVGASGTTGKKPPPPPPPKTTPSASSATISTLVGGSIDSILSQRAKTIFGQL